MYMHVHVPINAQVLHQSKPSHVLACHSHPYGFQYRISHWTGGSGLVNWSLAGCYEQSLGKRQSLS